MIKKVYCHLLSIQWYAFSFQFAVTENIQNHRLNKLTLNRGKVFVLSQSLLFDYFISPKHSLKCLCSMCPSVLTKSKKSKKNSLEQLPLILIETIYKIKPIFYKTILMQISILKIV